MIEMEMNPFWPAQFNRPGSLYLSKSENESRKTVAPSNELLAKSKSHLKMTAL